MKPQLVKQYDFELSLEVRDYEVDMFGIVNHAVYAHYFEHTRHTFLKSKDLSIPQLCTQGYNPVVTELDIKYRRPLVSGDRVLSRISLHEIRKVKFVFIQELYLQDSEQLTTQAWVTGTILSPEGRPKIPESFENSLKSFC